ncbi:MAG TPA: hypothetical protein VNE62_02620 [Actinomycetota bacterium]|nr:hypothetical protein [Actinomycetota bacterium]
MSGIVGMFAAVGLGMGLAAVLFLNAIGFYKARSGDGLEGFGEAIAGSLALGAVLVFSILVGTVLAAMAGIVVARVARSGGSAAGLAALASGLGHLALVAAAGAVLLGGSSVLAESAPDTPAPTPEPVESRDPEERADCVRLFGADSRICQDPTPEPADDINDRDDGDKAPIALSAILKLALGVLPAALVGALTGLLLFTPSRRRRPEV